MSESSSSVREHYDQRPNQDTQSRKQSPIYRLRAFNNWIKAVQINEAVEALTARRPSLSVLDMACGKGGDLGKWRRTRTVGEYWGVDIAPMSIEHARERLASLGNLPFAVHLRAADAFAQPLPSDIPRGGIDVVTCQFALHYAFRTENVLRQALQNVADSLRPGGLFIGTLADGDAIRRSPVKENDVFKVTFGRHDGGGSETFGVEYRFLLVDAIDDCPEYLSNRFVLEDVAESVGLRLQSYMPFAEFYVSKASKHGALLVNMDVVDPHTRQLLLSPPEMQVAELYSAFCFQRAV